MPYNLDLILCIIQKMTPYHVIICFLVPIVLKFCKNYLLLVLYNIDLVIRRKSGFLIVGQQIR